MSIRPKRSLQTRTLQYLSTLICVTFFSGTIVAAPTESFWGASATTAVSETFKSKTSTSYSILNTPYGSGVGSTAHAHNCFSNNNLFCEPGISKLFVPVTARLGESFSKIWLRALDNESLGHVTATLYRQAIGAEKTEQLGTVSTTGQGFEIAHNILDNYIINIERKFTYYIEIKMVRTGLMLNQLDDSVKLMAFDVGLGGEQDEFEEPCITPPDWAGQKPDDLPCL